LAPACGNIRSTVVPNLCLNQFVTFRWRGREPKEDVVTCGRDHAWTPDLKATGLSRIDAGEFTCWGKK
jgi:hypothetical protein